MKKFVIDVSYQTKLSSFVLENFPQISYHTFQKILRKKDVYVNRERVAKDVRVEKGDFVEIYCPDSAVEYFSVVYEDANIIVVNKAFGIIVAEKDKTRVGEISLQEVIEKKLRKKVFPLHRIDMNTSGLVIFCKSLKVFDEMKIIMQNHEVSKVYLAEVVGKYNLPAGTYYAFLEKNSRLHSVKVFNEKKSPKSMPIETFVECVVQGEKSSIVRVEITNGKTHQIRAHMAHLGFALVGDNKYGKKTTNKKFGLRKQKLLAQKLVFKTKNKKYEYLNNLNIELSQEVIDNFFGKNQKNNKK